MFTLVMKQFMNSETDCKYEVNDSSGFFIFSVNNNNITYFKVLRSSETYFSGHYFLHNCLYSVCIVLGSK